jgi:hypothetical protein
MNDRIDVNVNQERAAFFHNSLIVAIVWGEWRLDFDQRTGRETGALARIPIPDIPDTSPTLTKKWGRVIRIWSSRDGPVWIHAPYLVIN